MTGVTRPRTAQGRPGTARGLGRRRAERRAAWRQVALGVAGPVALAVLLPLPGVLLQQVRDGVDAVAVLGAAMLLAVSVVVWALLVWGMVVLGAAGFSRLPGAAGRIGRAVLRATTPAMARRVLVVAAGVSVMAGAAACGTQGAAGATNGLPVAVSAPLSPSGDAPPTTGPAYRDGGYAGPASDSTGTVRAGNATPVGRQGSSATPTPSPGHAGGASPAGVTSSSADTAGAVTSSAENAPPLLDLDWPTAHVTDASTTPEPATPSTDTAGPRVDVPATHGTAATTEPGTTTEPVVTTEPGTTTKPAAATASARPDPDAEITATGEPTGPSPTPITGTGMASDSPAVSSPTPTASSPAPASDTEPTTTPNPKSQATPSPAPTSRAPHTSAPGRDAPASATPSSGPGQATPHRTEPHRGTSEPAKAHRVTITVRPGDSLWAIAALHLPAGASPTQIDAAWRQWYAANQSEIGSDPNLILPGQQLTAPTSERTSS